MTTIILKPNDPDRNEETPEWKAKLEEAMAKLAALNQNYEIDEELHKKEIEEHEATMVELRALFKENRAQLQKLIEMNRQAIAAREAADRNKYYKKRCKPRYLPYVRRSP